MKKRKRQCAYCEGAARMSVQHKLRKGAVFICGQAKCWKKYWKELPQK